MMVYMDRTTHDIVSMPRGGPDASWLDRRMQTDRLEYLDRDDVDDLKGKVIQALDRSGRRRFLGAYKLCARAALREVSRYRLAEDPRTRVRSRRAVAQATGVSPHR